MESKQGIQLQHLADALVADPREGATKIRDFVKWFDAQSGVDSGMEAAIQTLTSIQAKDKAELLTLASSRLPSATTPGERMALTAVLDSIKGHYFSKARHHDLSAQDRKILAKVKAATAFKRAPPGLGAGLDV